MRFWVYLSGPTIFFLSLFLFGLLVISAPVWAAESNVTIISSTSSEFICELTFGADGGELQPIQVAESSHVWGANYQIAVPFGATAAVTNSAWNNPTAIASAEVSGSGMPMVRLSGPLVVRGRRLAALSVLPVANGSIYQKVAITVTFSGSAGTNMTPSAPDPIFDKIWKSQVLNYDAMSGWGVPTSMAAKVASVAEGPLAQSGDWYKVRTTQTGLIRITGAEMENAGVSLSGLASSSVRLFYGGGLPLEMLNDRPRATFDELPVLIQDGGDGQFGRSDVLYFYGEALNRWIYEAGAAPRYVNNIYDQSNAYWLTISGDFANPARRMGTIVSDPSTPVDTTITSALRRIHIEQDNLLLVDADGHTDNYYQWYWDDSTGATVWVSVPSVEAGDSALIAVDARTGSPYSFLTIGATPATKLNCTSTRCQFSSRAMIRGLNQFSLTFTPLSSKFKPYFNYIEVTYRSHLEPENNRLDVVVEPSLAVARIQMADNFAAAPLLLDITDPRNPSQIVGYVQAAGELTFTAALTDTRHNHYYAQTLTSAAAVSSIARVAVNDLYDAPGQTDMMVVTIEGFADALQPYRDYRSTHGHSTQVVTVEDIMDNFSFGLYDPTAIRDFLKYTYENYPAPAPAAVLFVGDANYDYLDRLRTGAPNFVPSYINPLENSSLGNTYSDDNYVYFGVYGLLDADTSFLTADRGYDMMTARWPVKNASEITTITDKIIRYESSESLGDWRTNITLVADDEFGSFTNETFHTTQTEELANNHVPRYFTKDKLYLWEYPFVNRFKPEVNAKLVDAINRGTLLVNYVGHGNPDVWAHERVFTRTADLPRLQNQFLPLIVAASCAIGFFDDPKREAMGEDLLSMSSGAIGVLSAMRIAFSSDNAVFNRRVYDVLLYNDSLTVGEAIYTAKLLRQYGIDSIPRPVQNDRGYVYFGDPFLRLATPKLDIAFDQAPDSLMALEKTTLSGRVINDLGQTSTQNGKVYVTVFDSDRQKTHRILNASGVVVQQVNYAVTGPAIFRGSAEVTNGLFALDFIAPLDLGYGGTGGKVLAYAVLDTVDAASVVDSIPVSGTIATTSDSSGPSIEISTATRPRLIGGEQLSLTDALVITLSDSSGINLSGSIGHGISIEIDDRPDKTIDATELFAYEAGSYTTGQLTLPLRSVGTGEHNLTIKVWDNANNASALDLQLTLQADLRFVIGNLLNHPNPMQQSTTFYFELTGPADRFSLDIFTLAGRKIRSFSREQLPADMYPNTDWTITWDGRDDAGDRVATGVYIYKATAQPLSGEPAESLGKVVVIN